MCDQKVWLLNRQIHRIRVCRGLQCLQKKASFKVKSLHFANPSEKMLSPLPARDFHHATGVNGSLCCSETPLASL